MFKQLTLHECQGHRVIITSKSPTTFLKEGTNVCKKLFLGEFHAYQEIVGTNVQIRDLVHLLAGVFITSRKRYHLFQAMIIHND